MLSNGYLQPANNAIGPVEKIRDPSVALSIQEQQTQELTKEQGFKNTYGPDARASTAYRYSVDQNGNRYISGAYVSTEASDKPLSEARNEQAEQTAGDERRQANADGKNEKHGINNNDLSPEEEAIVRELQRTEQEVIAHEAAHQAAGGGLAGAVSYSYTRGPDGRNYITGGEVPIKMPASDDPEQTLRDMEQVQRAAMAPANPSPQDAQVAAQAAAKAASARQELAAERARSSDEENNPSLSGISSVRAGLMFENLHGEYHEHEHHHNHEEEDHHHADALYPVEAYSRNMSGRGLWTLRNGFEQIPHMAGITGMVPRLNVAA